MPGSIKTHQSLRRRANAPPNAILCCPNGCTLRLERMRARGRSSDGLWRGDDTQALHLELTAFLAHTTGTGRTAADHTGSRRDQGPHRGQPRQGPGHRTHDPQWAAPRRADLQRRLRRPLRALRQQDGLRLRHQHDRWTKCQGGTHPRHRHHPIDRLRRALPRRRPAHPAQVDRVRISVGAVDLGPPRRDVRHVLLDPGHQAARLRLQADGPGMCHDDARGEHGDVHLPRHQHEPVWSVRRRLLLGVHLSLPGRWRHRPQHLHSFRRHAMAALEERR